MKEDNPDECIDQAPNLHEKLRQVACRLIDSCVPICQELERAEMAKPTAPKEATELGDAVKVDEKSSHSSLKEIDAPVALVPNVPDMVNPPVPENEEEKEVSMSNIQANEKENLPSHEAALSALDSVTLEKINEEITEPTEKKEKKLAESISSQGSDQKLDKVNATVPENKEEKEISVSSVPANNKKKIPQEVVLLALDPAVLEETNNETDESTEKEEKSLPETTRQGGNQKNATVPEDKEKKISVKVDSAAINEEEFKVVSKKSKARKAKKQARKPVQDNPSALKVDENKKSFVDAVKVVANPSSEGLTSAVKSAPLREVTIHTEKKRQNNQVEVKVLVPADTIGFVIGYQFSNIHRLESKYGVKVTLPPKGGSDILLTGPADGAAAAEADILDSLPCRLTHQVEKRYHGAIVGHQGNVINGLRKEYNIDIILIGYENLVVIEGKNKQRCQDALNAIKSIIVKQDEIAARRAKK